MGYHRDLSEFSIDEFQKRLENQYLPPSRNILRENTTERFDYFKSIGVNNIKDLIQLLKKKDNFNKLSKINCFSGDYLTLLLRELNGILPKPNKLSEFSIIQNETIAKLEKIGVKNTFQLFDRVFNKSKRNELAKALEIDDEEIHKLAKLTDLSRIKWAGVKFAELLYHTEFDTLEKIVNANPIDLHKDICEHNKALNIYKGNIKLKDIEIFIDAAKETSIEIMY